MKSSTQYMENNRFQQPVPILNRLESINAVLFLLFLFFLPLYEAPKNIFSGLFVLLGFWIAFKKGTLLRPLQDRNIEAWAFLLLALSPFFAGINSPYLDAGQRFSSALNWALMPLVAFVFLLTEDSETLIRNSLRVLCMSAVVGVMEAFYSWDDWIYPQLNSLGHVNQSALYLAFSMIPSGMLLFMHRNLKDSLLAIGSLVAVFIYQAPAKSLVGVGTSVVILASFWAMFWIARGQIKFLTMSIALGLCFLPLLISTPPSFFGPYEEFKIELDERLNSKHHLYSHRDRLVNSALEVAGDSLTGFGLGSYGSATQVQNIRTSVIARGGNWAEQRGEFFSSTHGHNIFATVIVERGWLGVLAIGSFLLAISFGFLKLIKKESSQIGFLTVMIIWFAGLGQSTLHVEHGQLALVCLALCMKLSLKTGLEINKSTVAGSDLKGLINLKKNANFH